MKSVPMKKEYAYTPKIELRKNPMAKEFLK